MALTGMETDSSSFPTSSSSSAARRKYDVFLSFRGEDTRNTLADLLYDAFNQKGINAFKDDEKLEKGKTISPGLSRAIEESRFAVVIFSKNYASSTWCLDELAKIIHCEEHMGMKILPVFYDVEPSDVRKQLGTFAQAFIAHEKRFKENIEKVNMWRVALTHVGNLSGWPLMNRPFSQVIKSIVRLIWHNLNNDAFSEVTKGLVGIDSHVVELESHLDVESNDVRFIGIWAMGGMGKTTLAWVIYHMVSKDFEACSFIEDVRENFDKKGIVPIQQKIIDQILMEKDLKIKDKYDGVFKIKNGLHQKRILLVLDDVDKLDMLNMLVGEHNWFGPGSRVIITTRYRQVLKTHGVDEIYEVKGLNDKNAFQLFCLKAFKKEHVPDDYIGLSNHFLKYAAGLPLALEVLGSFLFKKSTVEWKSALERLKEHPNPEVLHVLQISYNKLQDTEKEIFLHIACFFNHNEKDYVVEVLDNLGLYASIGLKELIDKSLLKILDDDVVWMHDLLAEMGKNIVFQECPDDPGKRNRLWVYEDIDKVFRKNKGTKAIQAMDIWGSYFLEKREATWNPDAFLKMYKLKFLRVNDINYVPTHLPDDLRILDWTYYPSKSLPLSCQLDELVQLRLQRSEINQIWIGRKNFDKLKFIDMAYSSNLITTPDFAGVPNLEKLVFEHCTNLRDLHPSIEILKKLVVLNLAYCEKLSSLPSKFEMDSLKTLSLSCCVILEKIPEFMGSMVCLQKLFLDCTAIMELPSSIGGLIGLTSLILMNCKNLVCLPSSICCLTSLESLDLSRCSKFDNLPKNIGNAKGLKMLDLSGTAIKELPSSIECLTCLTSLNISNCKNFVCLPSTICSLKSLKSLDLSRCSNFDNLPENLENVKGLKRLDLSGSAIKELPSSIEHLPSLTSLNIRNCKDLVCLPNTTCGFKFHGALDLSTCSRFKNLPENPWIIEDLGMLDLSETAIEEIPSSIGGLIGLTSLTLKRCKNLVCLPSTICSLKSLESLDLFGCSNFDNLPENLGNVKDLKRLDLSGTAIKELPSSIGGLIGLTSLTLRRCKNLMCLPSTICSLKSLESLDLSGCSNFDNLPENLENVKGLKKLDLSGSAIKELPSSIEHFPSLTSLNIRNCKDLVCLPNTTCGFKFHGALDLSTCSRFKNLPENPWIIEDLLMLDLSETAIEEIPSSIGGLIGLTSLTLRRCKNLVCLPSTICSLKSLESLHLFGCSNFDNLPKNLGNIEGLKRLNLGATAIKELPSSIECLTCLTSLNISYCKNFVCLSSTICSLKSLKSLDLSRCSNFDNLPENLENVKGLKRLDLSGSAIKELPSSIEHLPSLTSLNIRNCKDLVCLPNTTCGFKFHGALDLSTCSRFKNLPENPWIIEDLGMLDLSETAIEEIPSSIGGLIGLTSLTLKKCKNLVCLPSTICSLKSLKSLDLFGCSNFDNLPENLGNVKGLKRLDLSETAIKELPSSIGGLIVLTSLTLRRCKNLVCLPSAICSLKSLESLYLSGCSNFDNLPENLENVKGLKRLDLSGSAIKELPSSIEHLPSLTSLNIHNCKDLVCLPNTTCGFKFHGALDLSTCSRFKNLPENPWIIEDLLMLDLSKTAIEEIPSSIGGLIGLTSLTLRRCKNLVRLPSTICNLKSLESLHLFGCSNFDNLPKNLGNIESLKRLDLGATAIKELPSSIGGLIGLTSLTLRRCKNLVCLPSTICSLKSLESLDLSRCSNFDNLLENLENVKGLKRLDLSGSAIKELPSSIEHLPSLTSLNIRNCKDLVCLPNTTCGFKFRGALDLSTCSRFKNLPENPWIIEDLLMLDLSKTAIEEISSSIGGLIGLTSLTLRRCKNLVRLPSTICSLKSLESLHLFGCSNFDNLPKNLGNIESLKRLDLGATAIKELPSSIGGLIGLTSLTLRRCKNLVCLPSTICNLKSLESLDLSRCSNFDNLPENLENVKGLKRLDLSGSAIKELPSSIEHLPSLTSLNIRNCKDLVCLPNTTCGFKFHGALDLSTCSRFKNLPENPWIIEDLLMLDLSKTAIEEISSSIGGLIGLTSLTLRRCKNLVRLPSTICSLKSLESLHLFGCSNFDNLPKNLGNIESLKRLDLGATAIKELPSSIGGLIGLTSLTLRRCKNLVCLPSTICNLKLLESLDLSRCSNLDNLPENLENVKGLKGLDLSGTAIKDLPSSIERLTNLTSLNIFDCKNLVCLPNTTCGFKFHGALDLSKCLRFKNLPENPWIIKGLEELNLSRTAIKGLPSSIEHLTNLTLLTLRYCVNLVHLPSTICSLKLLNSLDLSGCLKFDNLPENIGNMEGLEVLNLCWTAIKEVPSSIVLLKNLTRLCIRGWKLSEYYFQPESPEWLTSFSLPRSRTTDRILLPSYIYSSLQTSPALVGLSLPSLSGLQSLTYLYLSHCDLSSIPSDIGCLSSLRYLDLSGNNFVSIPESMSQLSNLRSLYLEGCKRLQSLENVPSTIDSISAGDCMSLERLPELLYYRFRLDCAVMQFHFFNCFKLVDNSMLQGVNNMLQGQSGRLPKKLQIIIPGSEIPQYFNHECIGHELKVQVPSNWSIPPIRIAFCVVFVPNNGLECPRNWELSFIIDGFAMYREEISGSMKKYDTIESHHLWLTYFSYLNGGHPLTIRASSWNLKVEKIGVRFIYLHDIEIPSKTMAQCINNSNIVVHHDIDDSIAECSGNKRSRDEDDGAGPSKECYSIVEPLPKRIQRLGGFMVDFEDPSQREFSDFFATDAEDQMS